MSKEINGSIPYTIKISDDGHWNINYESTIENDLVAMSISQFVIESYATSLKSDKKTATGKVKQSLSVRVEKLIQARFGVKLMLDFMQTAYEPFMKENDNKGV
jgi:hypothetical protein